MRTLIRCSIGIAVALSAGTAGYLAGAQESKPAEPARTLKVNEVARVGERVITAEEFIQRLVDREAIHRDDAALRTAKWALDSLIIEELLAAECQRLQASVKRREWDAEFKALDDQFNDQLERWNRETGASFTKEEFLKKINRLSLIEYETKMRAVAKDRLERRMVVNYWLLSTQSADGVGLLVSNLDAANDVLARLRKGEKIGPIAREKSEDMVTRAGNGEIGTIYPKDGTLETEVDAAFWKLKDGEWSEPIKTSRGHWIVGRVKTYLANEAPFFDLREDCLSMSNPTDGQLLKWRHALAASGRVHYERRMPGWDVQAGQ